ncbi:MAG TPA: radical SAM protein [Polyangia bacterium]|jgi:radical SAM protein with 4Fe4S-binding SPASM domain|nr:radical SAM protein [Polyangia bacterium]
MPDIALRRSLPVAPEAQPARRHLPLAPESRRVDEVRPIYAVWEITLRCDLACVHCGSRAGRARPDELTTAECLDLVDQMADLGVREVTLIGGEAYLRDDWLEIVRALRRRGIQATMTTGGRGLTAERVAAAAEAGLQSVSVSLDGLEATHDRLRGVRGSYQSALSALSNLRAAGLNICVNTQVNRLSLAEMPAILDTVIAVGAKAWQVQLTAAMGRAADQPDLLPQPSDLLELFPMLAALKHRCDKAGVMLWPGNNIGYFGPYEAVLRGTMPSGHMASCGAGRTTLGIEADGAIKGCPSLQTDPWTGGNLRDASLRDIWERSAPLRYTRDRTVDDLWGYCRTCYYADTCLAGCTWTSFSLFGKAGNNPLCHHRALEFQRQGKRERLVPVAPAPGQPFDNGRFDIVIEEIPT